jgi:uncharacterized membrane protein YdcZ (DUF606 family)
MMTSAGRSYLATAMAASVLVGALTSVQSRMNGELSIMMHNSIEAALYSYGSGLLVLILVVLLSRRQEKLVADPGRHSRRGCVHHRRGLGPAGKQAVTWQRVVGAALARVAQLSGQQLSGHTITCHWCTARVRGRGCDDDQMAFAAVVDAAARTESSMATSRTMVSCPVTICLSPRVRHRSRGSMPNSAAACRT